MPSVERIRPWLPAYETYTRTAVTEGKKPLVDQGVTADFKLNMDEAWPKAVALLALALRQQVFKAESGVCR